MLILFPKAPARHEVSHRVLCYPLLPVKVKLPLSFLRFFAPVAGSWSFVRAPAPPAHHKTTRMHGSLRQVGHQHTPHHPQHTVSSPHDWTHINTWDCDQMEKKLAEIFFFFLFEAGGRVLDFATKAETIHFNVLGFLGFFFNVKEKADKTDIRRKYLLPFALDPPRPRYKEYLEMRGTSTNLTTKCL